MKNARMSRIRIDAKNPVLTVTHPYITDDVNSICSTCVVFDTEYVLSRQSLNLLSLFLRHLYSFHDQVRQNSHLTDFK